ncbi:hypothetical protein Mesop_2703 [Mesorhizobium opportunistum WSM2075]|uniref:Uncharacterized protein n=1 Tax=Mesorhizobium opportunistum (strain LMG 24607 / HAMBI 3007 / WSM2075) TaxID=536019 RepID=F7Y256_MESOW|nr:hypothetical protein Mesop_2703 [Mesorhizobium opportunistum WSM2075]
MAARKRTTMPSARRSGAALPGCRLGFHRKTERAARFPVLPFLTGRIPIRPVPRYLLDWPLKAQCFAGQVIRENYYITSTVVPTLTRS